MQKPDSKDTDQLILDALEMALVSPEPALLVSSKRSEAAALFPDETGERRKAIAKCIDGTLPLLVVVYCKEPQSVKQSSVERFVEITPQGIDHLFSNISIDKASGLLAQAAFHATRKVQTINESLDKVLVARERVIDNVKALIEQLGGALERAQSAIHHSDETTELLKDWLHRLPIPHALLPQSSERPALRRPESEQEGLFRQRAAQEMVFAWQAADCAARQHVERALFNLGAEPIGSPGEKTEFSGRLHTCEEPVFPADIVEIKESGWLLRDELGGYLLAHARVVVKPEIKE